MKLKINKKMKEKKKVLLYIFLLIPFLKPATFEFIPIIDNIYKILFIISCLIIFYLCFKKKCISKFTIFTIIFEFIFFISCIINKNLSISAIKNIVEVISLSLLINYALKYNCKSFLKGMLILLDTLICMNFVTIILFPNGMYVNPVSGMAFNYLLGYDNTHISYFFIFWLILYIYNYIYKENNLFNIITLIVSILSILIRRSSTALVGSFIILLYFILAKFIDKSKIVNVISYVICYLATFVGIIFLRIQKIFSFLIIKILKKDITFTGRTFIWDAYIKQIKNSILIGHGRLETESRNALNLATHAHNLFLEITYQGGILYLGSLLYLIYISLKNLKKHFNYKLSKVIMAFIFAYFFMMLVENYSLNYIIILLSICYCIDSLIKELNKNKSEIKNKVIVIGGNHYNMLGVIRSLGQKNIKPYLIIATNDKYCYISKSKYVMDFDIVKEDREEILKVLKNKYIEELKPILIPTSDFSALFIDENLNVLKKNFIVPSINNKQGEIKKLMDKYNQYKLSSKYNIKMAKTYKIDLNSKLDKNIPFPCILKPITSAFGEKKDIEICNDRESLLKSIKRLRDKNYKSILLQELLDYEREYCIIGCANNDKLTIAGLVQKERIYPPKRGSTCYGKMIKSDKLNIDNIKKLMSKLNYQGIFDIDLFLVNNEVYLNEINFRNSAISYSCVYGNANIIYTYLMMLENKDMSLNKQITSEYYFQEDMYDFKLVLEKQISLIEYIRSFIKSKVHLNFNIKDLKPIVYKFIYAVRKRIKK